jgi:uncharacterized membrane protein YsdA (DUF1294 family)
MAIRRKGGRRADPYWAGVVLSAITLFLALWLFLGIGFFIGWAVSMTFVTAAVYSLDKIASRRGRRRASEMLLMVCAIVGGGVGALLAMVILPHKKNKPSFWAINLFSGAMWGFLMVWELI